MSIIGRVFLFFEKMKIIFLIFFLIPLFLQKQNRTITATTVNGIYTWTPSITYA
jgi:hypothetical protein